VKDLKRILFAKVGGDHRVAPQLAETAAWLSGVHEDLRRVILSSDPAVLLRSDVATLGIADRKLLADRTLEMVEHGLFSDHLFGGRLTALCHPLLGDQLRPCLSDKNRSLFLRRFAISLAHACRVDEVEAEVLALARNTFEPANLRAHAISFIAEVGSDSSKRQLKPFIHGSFDDPHEEMKGAALSAVWPKHISAAELFSVLHEPTDQSFAGNYVLFVAQLARQLGVQFTAKDVIPGLEWAGREPISFPSHLSEVMDEVVLKAWAFITDDDVIARSLAQLVIKRLENHSPIICGGSLRGTKVHFGELLSNDARRRRRLIAKLLPLFVDGTRDPRVLYYSQDRIVADEDIPWLIEQYDLSDEALAETILRTLDQCPPTGPALDAISLALATGRLPERFRRFVYVPFGSSLMVEQRHDMALHLWYSVRHATHRKKYRLRPSPSERIATALERVAAGETSWWTQLTHDLTLKEDSTAYEITGGDLTTLPGWKDADRHLREKIIDGAELFVSAWAPDPATFIGKNRYPSSAMAAYQAIALLFRNRRASLEHRPPEFWHKWMPLILWYPFSNENGSEGDLIGLGTLMAPRSAVDCAHMFTDSESQDVSRFVRKLKAHWTVEVELALADAVLRAGLGAEWTWEVVDELVRRDNRATIALLEDAITTGDPSKSEDLQTAVKASVRLLCNAARPDWQTIWARVMQSEAFGRALAENLALHQNLGFIPKLSEDQAGDLFVWVSRRYPASEDPKHVGAYNPTARDEIVYLRSALPQYLVSLGTEKAINVLKRARQDVPELDWLKWHELQAKSIALENAWRPIHPGELLAISSQRDPGLQTEQSKTRIIEICVVVLGLLFPVFLPGALTFPEKLGVGITTVLVVICLFEIVYRRRSFWLPLWLILLLSALVLESAYFFSFRSH
jgi:hypothetical protein